MSRTIRRLGIAAAVAASALVVAQASAAVAASAATPKDGSAGANKASVSASATPYFVRTHAAKLAHPMKATQKLRLTVGLKLRNQSDLDKFLASVNDAQSRTYHQYLSAAQFNSKYGPTSADEAAVTSWAKSKGLTVSHTYSNRLVVDLTGTAGQVQSALGVHMNNYTMNGYTYFSNDRDPALPSSLKSVVSSIEGLNNIETLKSATSSAKPMTTYSPGAVSRTHIANLHGNGSKAALKAAMAKTKAHPHITGGAYDPTDLYSSQAYDVNAEQNVAPCCNPQHLSSGSPAATSIAVATAGSHAYGTDIPGFATRYNYLAFDLNEQYIDGTPSSLDYEGTMDAEWAMSMANSYGSYLDTSHIYVYSGVNAGFGTFTDIFNTILSNNTAKIVTSSWGCAEFFCYDDGTMNTDHGIFNSMAAQGFTMVNSSDDKGAYATCNGSDGRSVQFPASDPNWLAIAATNLELSSGPVFQSEPAWSQVASCASNGGGSGGGCSAKFAAPSWQSVISNCGTSARALPDIALNGDWANSPQNVFFNGGWSGNGGTSISAPMSSGFFARLNSYRIQMGNVCGSGSACGPIGTAASAIYSSANSGAAGRKGIYDVIGGDTSNDAGSGFLGVTGYDRASGWGSFNFLQLAYDMNWYGGIAEASAPTVAITGPSTSGWVNSGYNLNVYDNGSPVPSGVAGYTVAYDSAPDDTLTEPHGGAGNSYYSGPATSGGATNVSLTPPTGCHTLYVRAWDNEGLSTISSYGPVCYDGTAPSVTQATVQLNTKTQMAANGSVSVNVAWSGSDATSGIGSYVLYRNTDGGSYSLLSSGSASSSYTDTLAPGHTYNYAVGAYDNANNFSGYQYTTTTVNVYDQSASAVTYPTSGWTLQGLAGTYLGKVKYSTTLGNRVDLAFSGYQVGVATTIGPTYGNESMKVDGGTGSIISETNKGLKLRQVLYKSAVLAGGSHTLDVRNLGSSGHSRIDADAFIVLS